MGGACRSTCSQKWGYGDWGLRRPLVRLRRVWGIQGLELPELRIDLCEVFQRRVRLHLFQFSICLESRCGRACTDGVVIVPILLLLCCCCQVSSCSSCHFHSNNNYQPLLVLLQILVLLPPSPSRRRGRVLPGSRSWPVSALSELLDLF